MFKDMMSQTTRRFVCVALFMFAGAVSTAQGQIFKWGLRDEEIKCNGTVNTTNPTGRVVFPGNENSLCVIRIPRNASSLAPYTALQITLNLQDGAFVLLYDGNFTGTVNESNVVANLTNSIKVPRLAVMYSQEVSLIVNATKNNSASLTFNYSTLGCQQTIIVNDIDLVSSPIAIPGRGKFQCNYILQNPNTTTPQNLLVLSFMEFNLTLNASLNITKNGSQPLSASGTDLPADVYSNLINLLLDVPASPALPTFNATITRLCEDCYKEVTVENSTVPATHTVPELHPAVTEYRLVISTPMKADSLVLELTELQLVSGRDRLTIVDGPSLNGPVLATLTDNSFKGYMLLSSKPQMIVQLIVDYFPVQRSFSINITRQGGVGHLYGSGTTNLVASNSTVLYTVLEAPLNKQMRVEISKVTVNETWDSDISIYDGPQKTSPLLVTFSSERHFPVVTTSNTLLMVTKGRISEQNFKIAFTSIEPGCDQISSAQSGKFNIAALASRVPSMCNWIIVPESGGDILLELFGLKLEANQSLTVYDGVQNFGTEVVQFTSKNAQNLLPQIVIPVSNWSQLAFTAGGNVNVSSTVVQAGYQVVPMCGGILKSSQGYLTTPSFPNQYPLNTLCIWNFPNTTSNKFLFFDFPTFQLATNHYLQFTSQNPKSVVMARFQTKPTASLLFKSNGSDSVTFSAQPPNTTVLDSSDLVAQGFAVNFWVLECGGNFTQTTGNFSTKGFPKNYSLCIWSIQLPPPDSEGAVSIVNMSLEVKGQTPWNKTVQIYDGSTLEASRLNVVPNILSRYNALLVVYNNTVPADYSNEDFVLTVNYSTYKCGKAQQCNNGICLHLDWRCNGVDDCGDDTDERNCTSPPAPSGSSGDMVRSYWVAICLLLGILLGIVLAIIIPKIIHHFRNPSYARFVNDPVVA